MKIYFALSLVASAAAFTGNSPVFHRAPHAQQTRSVRYRPQWYPSSSRQPFPPLNHDLRHINFLSSNTYVCSYKHTIVVHKINVLVVISLNIWPQLSSSKRSSILQTVFCTGCNYRGSSCYWWFQWKGNSDRILMRHFITLFCKMYPSFFKVSFV